MKYFLKEFFIGFLCVWGVILIVTIIFTIKAFLCSTLGDAYGFYTFLALIGGLLRGAKAL